MDDDKVIRDLLEKAREAVWREKWRSTIEAMEVALDRMTRSYLFELNSTDEQEK